MKPTNAHKYVTVSYIINTVVLLHVSATLVAVLREVHYKRMVKSRYYKSLCTNAYM